MKVITEPSVFLVGKQQVVDGEVGRFLAAHGWAWESDGESSGEVLCETAGRLCFDDRTEILTADGWKPVSEVTTGDRLATMNPADGRLEYQQPDAVHAYEYDGDLLCTDGRDISFAVTPEHRQFASVCVGGVWSDAEFSATADLVGKRFRVPTAAAGWDGHIPDQIEMPAVEWSQTISNHAKCGIAVAVKASQPIRVCGTERVLALAELVALYVANGSIGDQKGGGRHIVIYGRETARVREIAHQLGLKTSVYIDKRNGCPRTIVSGGLTLSRWFERECGRGYAAKKFPKWVMQLPAGALAVVWETMVKTDGHRYKSGREVVHTGSPTVADQLQEVLCKIGGSSKLSVVRGTNQSCFMVARKSGRPAQRGPQDVTRRPYRGKVFCPSTSNGIVYVRRDGKVHFSGNCYLSFDNPRPGGNKAYLSHIIASQHGSVTEHAVWTVIVTGVSRSLTHELIRHRAGVGVSQLSQRYVDESVAEYVAPPDLQECIDCGYGEWTTLWLKPDFGIHEYLILKDHHTAGHIGDDAWAGIEWLFAVATARRAYGALSDHLSREAVGRFATKTDARKFARQAARSVLPNATETKVALTVNARAARNIIEQRGSRHADPEIRRLANRLYEVLSTDSPALFCDYTKVPLPDGTYELVTDHRKV